MKLKSYITPPDWLCLNCLDPNASIISLDNAYDDAFGTIYPSDYNAPVCSSCGDYQFDAKEMEPNYED